MAFGGFNQHPAASTPTPDINMVPLIDVMLVLLIIFMVAAPLLTHSVKIDLPNARSQPSTDTTPPLTLAIDGAGQLFWNDTAIDHAALHQRLAAMARQQPQAELHLRAAKATAYQVIAEVLADAANAGVTRIGFVSDPNP